MLLFIIMSIELRSRENHDKVNRVLGFIHTLTFKLYLGRFVFSSLSPLLAVTTLISFSVIHHFVKFLSFYQSIFLFIYQSISIYLSTFLSINLSIYLFAYLSINLSICLPIYLSIQLPFYLFIIRLNSHVATTL